MASRKQEKYRFSEFEIDLAQRTLHREGQGIALGPKTFDLLVFFLQNPQQTLSENELLQALWPGSTLEESSLGQHIFLLRRALSTAEAAGGLLLDAPTGGYIFTAEVSPLSPDPSLSSRSDTRPQMFEGIAGIDQPSRRKSPSRPSASEKTDSSPRRIPSIVGGVVVLFVLAAIGWVSYLWMHRPQRASLGIVIADFENTTGDRDFDRALKTALTVDLEQSPFLAIAQRTNQVTGAPLSASTATEAIANPATDAVSLPVTRTAARETCQQLHDQAYLTGSIHRLSQKFLVSVEALDCSTNRNLAHSKGIADTADGVLSVLDKVAIDLRRQLGEPRQSVARFNQTLFGQRPPSLPALKAYSVAIALRATGKPREALLLLHRTTQLDPNFALAYSELGSIYADLGQHDLAATNLGKAYKLRDTVGDDQRFAITSAYHSLLTGDLQASIQNDKQWSELYPRNATPLVDLADLDIQIGKPAQALDSVRRALDLAPTNPQAYVTLARAEMHLGRLEEASATCQLAIARHQDVAPTHSILLQIAFLRLDQPAMDEQIAWAKGKPSEPYMQMQQALVYFATGKVKAAHSILSSLTAEASAESESQPASQFDPASDSKQLPETQATVPRIEAELGLPAAASAQLQHMPDRATSADIPVAWAEVGQTSRADSLRQRELETHPAATLWRDYYGPQISAAIALNQHKPDLAIQALQPASPYESKAFEVSALRGRAYLAGKQPALAEAEFHKILEHPGIDPLSHNYPLAQLGLARALAQQDKTVEASFAYKVVLQIWKDADPDLPPLREARAEYAKLSGGSSVTPVKSLPASRDHSSLSSRPKAAPLSAAHVAALRRR